MPKLVILTAFALTLAGCSNGNAEAQQAEIDRLRAETEKLRAEAAAVKRENDEAAREAARKESLGKGPGGPVWEPK